MPTIPLLAWLGGTLPPLGALWLVYRLVLRPERCFGYNRALLLLAPLLAAGLPLLPHPALPLPAWLAGSGAPAAPVPVLLLPGPLAAAPAAASGPGWGWLGGLYAAGAALALGRLAWQGWRLHRATHRLPREARPGYWLAYTGGRLPTSSFGRTVFWDETAALTPAEATAVLDHELAHVRQGHSLDVLWLEIWRGVLWPNPFVHLLLPPLRLTHELLADQAASPAVAVRPYATLLARLALGKTPGLGYSSLIQSFTFSFTLVRLAMLRNQTPVRRWKQWLALPVLAGLFLAACQKKEESAAQPKVDQKAREALFVANVKEAFRQDSLHHGGKGWQDETSTLHVDKAGNVTITHWDDVPPPPPPPVAMPASQLAAPPTGANKVYTYVDQMPHLPDAEGMSAIVQHIQDDLAYPAGPKQEGRVFVSFTVRADGNVGDPKIIKGLAPAYDAAVVAAVEKLPRFVSGQQGGQAVAVSFTVPVTFKNQP